MERQLGFRSLPRSPRSSLLLAGYVGVAVVGALPAIAALLLGGNPFVVKSWLGTSGVAAAVLSAGLGTILGGATIAASRALVKRAAWVRALHSDLRPAVRNADDTTLLFMAMASGVSEELFFRGFLTPTVGIIASSLAFGLLHQVRGRARWGWMAWATIMGLLFALLFRATGSLIGPMIAHVYVNAYNLRFLRDNDLEPKAPRALGGLLARTPR